MSNPNFEDGLDPALRGAADPSALSELGRGVGRGARLDLRSVAWALYEGVRDPFVIVVGIYIFAPYFATVVVGDPVRGQSVVADISIISGLIVAFTGPFLGSSIDRVGRRKPPLAAMTLLMVPLIAGLWWAEPGGLGIPVFWVAAMMVVINLAFAYGEILHNSLLMEAATPAQAPYASGLALSLGNLCSVLMLAFVLWAFALPGKVDWGFIPKHPLFGLDPSRYETARIVGPIVAGVFALGSIPLFLLTPDARSTGLGWSRALGQGVQSLKATLAVLRADRPAATFLAARMFYTDGMTALLTFGGVYAAGVMRWGTLEMLAYGIMLSIFAVVGGQVGARLDATLGPKRAVQIEILGAILCLGGQLGMGRERILFFWSFDPSRHAPLWNGPMFRTLPEVIYLGIGLGTALFVTGQYASSRTLLTRLAPEGCSASFFGLYALSGTVTVWLGSTLVRLFTGVFKTQQAGFAPIGGLLLVGLVGMLMVRGDRDRIPARDGETMS